MGASIDSALALALLYGLESTSGVLRCGRPILRGTNPEFRAFFRSLPVGLASDGRMAEDTPMLTVPLAKVNAGGEPVYSHGIRKLNDTAEVTALIRNAFTAQQDQNSVVILGGPATNLVKVLDLPRVKEVISRKVRFLAVAGGTYPDGPPEFNIKSDIPAARKLFAEWPTPIVASGYEIVGCAALSRSEHREGFRLDASPSGGGRLSRLPADAVRRPDVGYGRGALRPPVPRKATSSCPSLA